jgi:hypothetical protein
LTVKTNIKVTGGTDKDRKKILAAAVILEVVVNSQEFKDAILSHVWAGKVQFADNGGLTNKQIYEVIISGKEVLQPEIDYEWDFDVRLYSKRLSKVIGYTYPNITYINSNLKFIRPMTIEEVAGHMAHEYCHKLGFGHDFKLTKKRPYSVPYAVGYIIRDIAEKFLEESQDGKGV